MTTILNLDMPNLYKKGSWASIETKQGVYIVAAANKTEFIIRREYNHQDSSFEKRFIRSSKVKGFFKAINK